MRLLRGRQSQKTTSGGTVPSGLRGLFISRESPTAITPDFRLGRLITRAIGRGRSPVAATMAVAVREESPVGFSENGRASGDCPLVLPVISTAPSTFERLALLLRTAGESGRIGPSIEHWCDAQARLFGRGPLMSAYCCVLRLTISTVQEGLQNQRRKSGDESTQRK